MAAEEERQAGDVYQYWHRQVSRLIAEARPELDAELLAHILLGALHSNLVVHLVRRGDTDRLTATLHELVASLLTPRPRVLQHVLVEISAAFHPDGPMIVADEWISPQCRIRHPYDIVREITTPAARSYRSAVV